MLHMSHAAALTSSCCLVELIDARVMTTNTFTFGFDVCVESLCGECACGELCERYVHPDDIRVESFAVQRTR